MVTVRAQAVPGCRAAEPDGGWGDPVSLRRSAYRRHGKSTASQTAGRCSLAARASRTPPSPRRPVPVSTQRPDGSGRSGVHRNRLPRLLSAVSRLPVIPLGACLYAAARSERRRRRGDSTPIVRPCGEPRRDARPHLCPRAHSAPGGPGRQTRHGLIVLLVVALARAPALQACCRSDEARLGAGGGQRRSPAATCCSSAASGGRAATGVAAAREFHVQRWSLGFAGASANCSAVTGLSAVVLDDADAGAAPLAADPPRDRVRLRAGHLLDRQLSL